MKKVNLAVVGATGMVGRTFLKVLKEKNFPIDNLYPVSYTHLIHSFFSRFACVKS